MLAERSACDGRARVMAPWPLCPAGVAAMCALCLGRAAAFLCCLPRMLEPLPAGSDVAGASLRATGKGLSFVCLGLHSADCLLNLSITSYDKAFLARYTVARVCVSSRCGCRRGAYESGSPQFESQLCPGLRGWPEASPQHTADHPQVPSIGLVVLTWASGSGFLTWVQFLSAALPAVRF